MQLFANMSMQLLRTSATESQFKYGFAWFIFIFFLAVAISNVHFLNVALRSGDVLVVVPTYYVFNLVMCVVGAIIYFRSYDRFTTNQAVLFCCGVAVTLAGVYLLATRPNPNKAGGAGGGAGGSSNAASSSSSSSAAAAADGAHENSSSESAQAFEGSVASNHSTSSI